ncbi:hypothetical protein DPX16_20274 [Anabarilius grahami]|uniref:Uncharacterized protein n=1 Tax=Anabarilius grahami TaxID=495550 RepID=A0A3N0XEC7_ANAGA|nr:hypothetical protein DPX16_20274 [Anabarilius grahami]
MVSADSSALKEPCKSHHSQTQLQLAQAKRSLQKAAGTAGIRVRLVEAACGTEVDTKVTPTQSSHDTQANTQRVRHNGVASVPVLQTGSDNRVLDMGASGGLGPRLDKNTRGSVLSNYSRYVRHTDTPQFARGIAAAFLQDSSVSIRVRLSSPRVCRRAPY